MSGRILLGGVRFYANNRKCFITFKRYIAVDRPEPSHLWENISVPVPRRACVPLVNILLRILSGEVYVMVWLPRSQRACLAVMPFWDVKTT